MLDKARVVFRRIGGRIVPIAKKVAGDLKNIRHAGSVKKAESVGYQLNRARNTALSLKRQAKFKASDTAKTNIKGATTFTTKQLRTIRAKKFLSARRQSGRYTKLVDNLSERMAANRKHVDKVKSGNRGLAVVGGGVAATGTGVGFHLRKKRD